MICHGHECSNALVGTQRKWCSDNCRRLARTGTCPECGGRTGQSDTKPADRLCGDCAEPKILAQRFAENTCPGPNGCVDWTGTMCPQGYGKISRGNKSQYAHRVALVIAGRDLPDGGTELQVDHLCGRRSCVNPDHLEVVPRTVNVWRGRATKLTLENVAEIRRKYEGWTGNRKAFCELHAPTFGVSPKAVDNVVTGHTFSEAVA